MKLCILGLVLVAVAGTAAAGDCKHERALDFDVDAAGLSALDLTAGAGRLTVRGQPGADRITVIATACASSARLLDGLALEHRLAGQTLLVETDYPDAGWSWTGRQYAYIHLDVTVPERLELAVEDGSGPVEIERVGSVTIVDGSGDLVVREIAGFVRIEDGSGGIRVRNVAGYAWITDGSGEIDIDGVEGNVTIAEDGSGEIEIRNVVGRVEIDEDGSGGIRIAGVGGDVRIGRDGSGSIDVASVGGDFEVERDGGGEVSYRDVNGRVSVPESSRRRY